MSIICVGRRNAYPLTSFRAWAYVVSLYNADLSNINAPADAVRRSNLLNDDVLAEQCIRGAIFDATNAGTSVGPHERTGHLSTFKALVSGRMLEAFAWMVE